MARLGIEHTRATVPFELIEGARDLKEFHGKQHSEIVDIFKNTYGIKLSMNTLNDWLYYRTRLYA